ncbi:MAG: YihY/virulence factor BrkB family protein [Desulfocapsaceae bacterium]|nr:YihY/virulence factor BrkB family protein [Desulfocapsaceae bacterium]
MKTPSPSGPVALFSLRAWADRPLGKAAPLQAGFYFLVRIILITAREFFDNAISLRSSALTYTVLLSLVPILAISTAVVKGLGGGDQLRKAAYAYIETLDTGKAEVRQDSAGGVPPVAGSPSDENENLTEHLRSAVNMLFDYVDKTNFATLGSFGVAGILLTVIMVLGNIEEAMNAIWKVQAGRSLLRKVADYMTLLILMPISINVAFAASAFLKNPTLASKMNLLIPFSWLQVLLLKALPVLVIALTFSVMYMFFPNVRVKALPAFLGAVFAAVFWFAVQNFYISLQVGVARYNAIYGSFATFPLFLVWIYLGWVFFLTGAQVAYSLQNIKTYRLLQQISAPSLQLAAAFDIMDALYLAFAANRPLTAENLTAGLPAYSRQLIDEVLARLQSAELVFVSQSNERLLPASPREQFAEKQVVAIILGAEAPDTEGGRQSIKAIEAAKDRCRSLDGRPEEDRQKGKENT